MYGSTGGRAWAFEVALLVSAVAAWPIYRFLLMIKSRQTVSEYLGETHQKKQGTPTMGGLIVLPGFAAVALVRGDYRFLLLFLGFAAIGLLDDFIVPRLWVGKRGLGWVPKLALELIVAAACLVRFQDVTAGDFETVFLVLFFANAYNFADGLDALAGGLLLLIAPALLLLGEASGRATGVREGAALCGAVIPFLFLNAPPAKVFMGDVGSLPIGATLGLLFANIYHQAAQHSVLQPVLRDPDCLRAALLVLSLVLVVELVPVPLQILSVKLRKGKRLFPRTPIHHTFEHWGWPESRITWTFLLAQIVCSALALGIGAKGRWIA